VGELSRLCLETSTKLYVHELSFCLNVFAESSVDGLCTTVHKNLQSNDTQTLLSKRRGCSEF
jgi:hypothetical protein